MDVKISNTETHLSHPTLEHTYPMTSTVSLGPYDITFVFGKREVSLRVLDTYSGKEIEGPFISCGENTFEDYHPERSQGGLMWAVKDEQGGIHMLCASLKDKLVLSVFEDNGNWREQFWNLSLTAMEAHNG